jgi:hypothetical protein
MLYPIRRLGNYSDSYIEKLNLIKGFMVHSDIKIFLQGTSFGSTNRVVEISSKDPAEATYAIPDGFKKNSQMTIEDLRNR